MTVAWLRPLLLTALVQQAAALASTASTELSAVRDAAQRSQLAVAAEVDHLGDAVMLRESSTGEWSVDGKMIFVVPFPDRFVKDGAVRAAVVSSVGNVAKRITDEFPEVDVIMKTVHSEGVLCAKVGAVAMFSSEKNQQDFAKGLNPLVMLGLLKQFNKALPEPYHMRVKPEGTISTWLPQLTLTSYSNLTLSAPHPERFIANKQVREALAMAIAESVDVPRSQVGLIMALEEENLVVINFWVMSTSLGYRRAFVASLESSDQKDILERARQRLPDKFSDVTLSRPATAAPTTTSLTTRRTTTTTTSTRASPLWRSALRNVLLAFYAQPLPTDATRIFGALAAAPSISTTDFRAYSSVALIVPNAQLVTRNARLQEAMVTVVKDWLMAQSSVVSLVHTDTFLWVDFSVSFDLSSTRQKSTRKYAADGGESLSAGLCKQVSTLMRLKCGLPETSQEVASDSVNWLY